MISWLGRINYTYKNRYLLTATIRRDGSSRFGSGNKYGVFPSAAFAWRIIDEPFMSEANIFSNLKIRTSWGITGNQAIGVYSSLQKISPILYNNPDQLSTGFAPTSISNPDLGWEETEQFDVGMDISFLKERLTFIIDGYLKNTKDLLATVNLPPSSGFTSMLRNIGSIRNRGIELEVGGIPLQNQSISWEINANISFNKNKVVELEKHKDFYAPGLGNIGYIHYISEGEPLGIFFGFKGTGLDENGNRTYLDLNDDDIISDKDRAILGSPYPNFFYGLNSNFKYKNFDVNLSFNGVYGNKIFNYSSGYYSASLSKGYNQIVDLVDNYWTNDGKYPNPKYSKLNTGGYDRPSDRLLEDGSYLRLSNLRIGYNLSVPTENWLNLKSIMIYLSGRNLFTLTKYSGFDPEVNRYSSDLQPGVDLYTYPQARVITLGLRLKF